MSSGRITTKLAGCLIDGLMSNGSLEQLDLAENQVEDRPIELLAQILYNSQNKLKYLNLSGNMITDYGGQPLANSL